jgi:hypothetical protein
MRPETSFVIDQARWLSQPERWRSRAAATLEHERMAHADAPGDGADREFRAVMDLWSSLPTSHRTDVLVRLGGGTVGTSAA